jgi:dicarboxylate/amino acid:cation (Na+ or H+) symporter, DAACS family
VVIPLITSALILGVAEIGEVSKLGRLGGRCLALTLLFSSVSVVIALGLTNMLHPGNALSTEQREQLVQTYGGDADKTVAQALHKQPWSQSLLQIIPQNPIAEAAQVFAPNYTGGGILAVMTFALLFGLALAACPAEQSRPVISFMQGIFSASLKINQWAMQLAPYGVACLIFSVVARIGFELLQTLGLYMGVVLLGLLLHLVVTYGLALRLGAGWSPWKFFQEIRQVMLTAFSTSSSNVTLPLAIKTAEEKLKIPAPIARFVLTLGASANQNGTALYEGITVLFLAQVFGIELTLGQQITVAFMCILAGLGTAGVPGGSLPLVVGVLVTVGVPGEAIAIILGVDRLLDMCRTVVNVTGDLVCATVLSSWETKANS